MPPSPFQYAILRVVPRVERGECVNAGVVLFCRPRQFLAASVALDEQRLLALAPGVDLEAVRGHLDALGRIAAGDPVRGRDRGAAGVRAVPLAGRAGEHDHPVLAGAHRADRRPRGRARAARRAAGAVSRVTWVGHATALIELGGVRLLTDPVLRNWLGHLRRHGASPAAGVNDDLDAVLISHLHLDHLDLPSLKRLPRGTRVLVPRGAGALLRRQGFTEVDELAAGERADVAGLEVEAVPALHDGRRLPFGGAKADTIGFVAGRRVYFAGDTDLFEGMAELRGIDVALLPVWGWGPSLGEGHMDPETAARAAALLRPRLAVPIHWGTFYPRLLARYKPDRLTDPPHEFATALAQLAPEVDVQVLAARR